MAKRMTIRELERLADLLGKWHETHPDDGAARDEASHIRFLVDEEIDERAGY